MTQHSVSVGSYSASGSMYWTRMYSDRTQYIGCWLVIQNANPSYMTCEAQDFNGRYVQCTTTNSSYFQVLGTINDSTEITFFADGNGKCSYIYVGNSSSNRPSP